MDDKTQLFTFRTILIIVLVILMPPVGLGYLLYLIWKKKKKVEVSESAVSE